MLFRNLQPVHVPTNLEYPPPQDRHGYKAAKNVCKQVFAIENSQHLYVLYPA
ncbi:hypothetical protein ApDm4_0157 [Acetobacter pomorum]|nr:hypothetical protein ApDm4_0157 [Acetobacter pomorum]